MTWLRSTCEKSHCENEGETDNVSVPVVLLPSLFSCSSAMKLLTTDNSRIYHRINMLSKFIGDLRRQWEWCSFLETRSLLVKFISHSRYKTVHSGILYVFHQVCRSKNYLNRSCRLKESHILYYIPAFGCCTYSFQSVLNVLSNFMALDILLHLQTYFIYQL